MQTSKSLYLNLLLAALACMVGNMHEGIRLHAQVVTLNGVFVNFSGGTHCVMDSMILDGTATLANQGSLELSGINNSGVIQGDGIYQISRSFLNNGTFSYGKSTVDYNGPRNQEVTGMSYYNIRFSGGFQKQLGGTIQVVKSLMMGDFTTLALGSHNIRLLSDSLMTARVASVPGTASITYGTGRFIAERYVIGRRKYRILTSPVTSSESAILSPGEELLSLWGNWQNQGNNALAYKGTFITGGTAADGFDQMTTNASAFTYNSASRQFEGFTSANGKKTKYTPLKAGVPYYFFVWGDRTNSPLTNTPYHTIMTSTGKILTGDQLYTTATTLPLTAASGGFTMVGNPFASPIDWTTITRNDLADTFWGWDPNLGSTGGYVTVSSTGTATLIAPFSGTVCLDQYIQSGQGFFVQTTGTSPQLLIKESDKVDNNNNLAFRSETNRIPLIAVNLLYDEMTGPSLLDGAIAAFDTAFSNGPDKADAVKMQKPGEMLAMKMQSDLLSINARRMPQDNDTLHIHTSSLSKSKYRLQVFARQLQNSSLEAYLEDSYLKTSKLLSLLDTNYHAFTINASIKDSYRSDRFRIVFKSPGELTDLITEISAEKENRQVLVKWRVSNESGVNRYEVQRSVGNVFVKLGEVMSTGNNMAYQWTDPAPVIGVNRYRIRMIHADGATGLSRTVSVMLSAENPEMKIYPNPVRNYEINMQFFNLERGLYTARLFDVNGRLLMERRLEFDGSSRSLSLPVTSRLAGGIYYFQVANEKVKLSQNIFVE